MHQQTKQVQILWEKYLKASGAERSAVLEELRPILTDRAESLRALIRANPASLMDFSLPPDVRATLPGSLQPLLETEVELEGAIERDSSPEKGASEQFPYRLRDNRGRAYELYRIGSDPLFVEGGQVVIRGIALDDVLVFDASRPNAFRALTRSLSDTEPPSVSFAEPRQGQAVRERVRVRVQARDNNRVNRVEVFHDGSFLAGFDAAPYEFDWDTRDQLDGPHMLTAKAHDPDLNVAQTQALTVTIDNTPPSAALTQPRNQDSVSGVATLAAEANDVVGMQNVKFLVDDRAVGISVEPPYTFAWNTTAHPSGTHILEALAIDKAGNMARSAPVSVTVLNANDPPAITPVGLQTVEEGLLLDVPLSVNDPQGPQDPVSVTVENLPSWAEFDAAGLRVFGSPPFDSATQDAPRRAFSDIIVRACDAQPLCSEERFAINVLNVNHPPSLAEVQDIERSEGDTLDVQALPHDADGDPLLCKIRGLPAWAHKDEAACRVYGEIPHNVASRGSEARIYKDIRFEACDAEDRCITETFTLTVRDKNQRPVLDLLPDVGVKEEQEIEVIIRSSDPDGDYLSLELRDLPAGAEFIDEGNGQGRLLWTPAAHEAGIYAVTVSVTDDEHVDTQVFGINVRETSLSFSGRVTDDLDRAVAGVVIEYTRSGDVKKTVMADEQGYYVAKDLNRGTYLVKAQYGLRDRLPSSGRIHFNPLSHRIELGHRDVKDVNFTAMGF